MAKEYSVSILILGKDKASQVLGGIGSNIEKLGKAAIGLGLGAVAGVGALGAGLTKLAIDAAPMQGIEQAFRGIAEASGQSADEMLTALEKGSAGMITQRDLMEKYNLAAQLVGDTFANQLPGAMEYLTKVAAATGQDMGYMMDSLVRGVGRLSPMILDNLGIQVNLTEANEAYAQQIGKTVDELTKEEQQAALMAQVMEKLAKNTAAMPEVAGSAAQGVAAMGVKFENFKNNIGMALLPTLSKVAGTLLDLADKVLPAVVSFVESNVVPTIDKLAWVFTSLIGAVGEGGICLSSLDDILLEFLPVEVVERIWDFVASIQNLIETAAPYIEQVVEWIGEHVKLQDVLIALGIAIAAVVIPALYSIVAAAAPIIAVGVALVAVVALVRNAWENNWLGIRDAVGAVANFITEEVWPRIQEAFEFIQTEVVSPVKEAFEKLWAKAVEFWEGFWSKFQPALQDMYTRLGKFWEEIQPKLMEAWEALTELWDQVVAIWQDILQPALDRLSKSLGFGGDKTSDFGEKIGALAGFLLKMEIDGLINLITVAIDVLIRVIQGATHWIIIIRNAFDSAIGVFNAIRDKINSVADAFRRFRDSIAGFSLPSWLTPGSPTPLEIGLLGIGKALAGVQGLAGGPLFGGMTLVGASVGEGLAGGPLFGGMTMAGASMGGGRITNVTIVNHFGPGSVRDDKDILEIADAIVQNLELRGVGRVL